MLQQQQGAVVIFGLLAVSDFLAMQLCGSNAWAVSFSFSFFGQLMVNVSSSRMVAELHFHTHSGEISIVDRFYLIF